MSSNAEEIDQDDVLSMPQNKSLVGLETFKFSQFTGKFADRFPAPNAAIGAVIKDWLGDGVECERLKASTGGWTKGKIRIRFEFIPDEPPVTPEPSTPESSDLVLLPNPEQ